MSAPLLKSIVRKLKDADVYSPTRIGDLKSKMVQGREILLVKSKSTKGERYYTMCHDSVKSTKFMAVSIIEAIRWVKHGY